MSAAHKRAVGPVALVAVSSMFLLAGLAIAKDSVSVSLTGGEETPPVTTSASGKGKISVSGKNHTVKGSIKTTGIEGTMAHIHLGPPGKAGPPIVTLTKGADGTWTVPAGTTLTDDQYESFTSGNLYVNVHSAEHASGELRAQLKP